LLKLLNNRCTSASVERQRFRMAAAKPFQSFLSALPLSFAHQDIRILMATGTIGTPAWAAM